VAVTLVLHFCYVAVTSSAPDPTNQNDHAVGEGMIQVDPGDPEPSRRGTGGQEERVKSEGTAGSQRQLTPNRVKRDRCCRGQQLDALVFVQSLRADGGSGEASLTAQVVL